MAVVVVVGLVHLAWYNMPLGRMVHSLARCMVEHTLEEGEEVVVVVEVGDNMGVVVVGPVSSA